jgi:hypothetical protein
MSWSDMCATTCGPVHRCVIEVEVLLETKSGEHKFKVAQATVRGPAVASAAMHAAAAASAANRRFRM